MEFMNAPVAPDNESLCFAACLPACFVTLGLATATAQEEMRGIIELD